MWKTISAILCVYFLSGNALPSRRREAVETRNQLGMAKLLREMVNQTNSDTLNLPANSTSIRENIVDTFSCENRTYGYYADVDNDCQLFHVCLPTTAASGRNVTYRWSFICPAETIFNQEVLVCTRSREAIPCEESPMFYDVNLEFGKVEDKNKTHNNQAQDKTSNKTNNRRKEAMKRKQNMIVEKMMQEAERVVDTSSVNANIKAVEEKYIPVIEDVITEFDFQEEKGLDSVEDSEALFGERSITFKRPKRMGFRFKADVPIV